MKFNSFLWETYKNSTSGAELLELFSNLEKYYTQDNLKHKIIELMRSIELESRDTDAYLRNIEDAIVLKNAIIALCDHNIKNENDAFELLESIWSMVSEEDVDKENPESLYGLGDIEVISSALYLINPEYYFPYFFSRQFHIVTNIFTEFGIYLPPVPPKRDILKREQYYWELCKSIIDFRKKQNIHGNELPAFLYGFAINVIPKYAISIDLPAPKKAFFVGGGRNNNGDFEYLDKADNTTVYNWQGNPDAQPGDIVVMYCLGPRSYINSIWRAVTPGSIDPFFYFYNNVNIGHPIHVEHISWKEIQKDELLSQMPLVKASMQGINGRLIEKKYYDRILEILKSKKQDINILPQLENIEIDTVKLKNERDVEVHLLEPLFEKLGYNPKDWKRQFKVRMGRGEKVIPDYVIYPVEEKGNESGFWVWEAKYSIDNHKQLKKDFDQAKSYALRLRCKGLGLVSKEGIWISNDDYDFDKNKYWSWEKIKERDSFNELFDIVGNKK